MERCEEEEGKADVLLLALLFAVCAMCVPGLIFSVEGTTTSRKSSPVRYGSTSAPTPNTLWRTVCSSKRNEGPACSYPGCTVAVSMYLLSGIV